MIVDKSIKVSTTILEIPLIGQLPDHLWRLTIELALLAALQDQDGELPDLDTMGWYLRRNRDELAKNLDDLGQKGIVAESIRGGFVLKIFNRFKIGPGLSSSTERVRRYRARRVENGMTASPGYDEEAIKRRDQFKCVYCGGSKDICVDHIHPILQGGTDDYRNLACACTICNGSKSGRTPTQAGFTFLDKAAEERYLDYIEDMEFIR